MKRSTPAYAGKTEDPAILAGSFREHPRMRGENSKAQKAFDDIQGTPPHARGKPLTTSMFATTNRKTDTTCNGYESYYSTEP